jgi:hypothetical protein
LIRIIILQVYKIKFLKLLNGKEFKGHTSTCSKIQYYLQLFVGGLMSWCSQSWQCFPHVSKCQPLTYHGTKCDIIINIREHQRGNQKWTIQRNWQQSVHKTKRNKHQRNTIYATHRYAQTHTNNVNKTWALLQTTGGNIVFYYRYWYDLWTPYHWEDNSRFKFRKTNRISP